MSRSKNLCLSAENKFYGQEPQLDMLLQNSPPLENDFSQKTEKNDLRLKQHRYWIVDLKILDH